VEIAYSTKQFIRQHGVEFFLVFDCTKYKQRLSVVLSKLEKVWKINSSYRVHCSRYRVNLLGGLAVWGLCPRWGSGAKPLVRGQGGLPLKLAKF